MTRRQTILGVSLFALACLAIPREACRAESMRYSWDASARQVVDNIVTACGGSLREEVA